MEIAHGAMASTATWWKAVPKTTPPHFIKVTWTQQQQQEISKLSRS
jgi:hypothetical protein